ncbi:caspase family protein, partial [Leptolyngbya sp. FACHB-711]|nr:caspase family protein [Leptolyngbya sp. FACHB-711]
AVGREGEYEINIGTPLQNLRPPLSIDDSTAPQRVVDRLVHLAKYQAVQSLDNSGSKLSQAIEVELLREDGTPFDTLQNLVVKNDEVVILRLTNQGSQSLKVAVLDLDPTWAIWQIPIGGMESPFFSLERGQKQEIMLRMSVPDDEFYQQTKETLKVFAVQKGLADFRWLTLPPLDEPQEPRGAELEQALEAENAVTRGEAEGVNPLNQLLAAIGADLDKAPQVTRAATMVVDPRQEWVTKQIQIVVER